MGSVCWHTIEKFFSPNVVKGISMTQVCTGCVCRTKPHARIFIPKQYRGSHAALLGHPQTVQARGRKICHKISSVLLKASTAATVARCSGIPCAAITLVLAVHTRCCSAHKARRRYALMVPIFTLCRVGACVANSYIVSVLPRDVSKFDA